MRMRAIDSATLPIVLAVGVVVSTMATGLVTNFMGRAPWDPVAMAKSNGEEKLSAAVAYAHDLPHSEVFVDQSGGPLLLIEPDSVQGFMAAKGVSYKYPTKVVLGDPAIIQTAFERQRLGLNSLSPITFVARGAELDQQGVDTANKLIGLINSYPFKTMVVSVKDDIIWSDLARSRGESLMSYLKAHGADMTKVEYKYEEQPGSLQKRIKLEATLK